MAGSRNEGAARLDVDRFIEIYQWVNAHLPQEIGEQFDHFLDEPLLTTYPEEVGPLYEALALSDDRAMRAMAAAGVHHVIKHAPEFGVRIAARLVDDQDEAVAQQARETLSDLPSLLLKPDRPPE